MIPVTTFAGRRVALFGLGGSGLATARALAAGGAEVLAFDDGEAGLERARAEGIPTGDLRDADWSRFAALVLAPGVPLTHPAPHWTVELARAAGVGIVGDIELFCRERAALAPTAPFVAVTGTNGKSTTTALVSHVLASCGWQVEMGGNIGTTILSLRPPAEGRVHVVEMSSYQIDLTPSLEPTVGVLLNITPDHLDRHGTMENYAAVKERLVAAAELAVVGIDDPPSLAVAERLRAAGRPLLVVTGDMISGDGLHFEGSRVFSTSGTTTRLVADLRGIASLRGAHNAQNAAASAAVAEALGIEDPDIRDALASFPGLHHRMEEIGRSGAVVFVNDSKATNADSAEKALLSFPDGIHWILGGVAKAGGIEPLRPFFGRVEHAYLVGAATDDFARALDGAVPFSRCVTLENAVAEAAVGAATSGSGEPVVLLSPACASFDQFPNFEVRGNRFRELVRALPGIEMRS